MVCIARDKNVSLGFTWPRPAVEFQDDSPRHLLSGKEDAPLGLEEDTLLGLEENVPLGLEEDVLPGRNEASPLGLEEARDLEEVL